MNKPELKPKDLVRLQQVFENKNWYNKINNDSVFNDFCILLSHLSDEQKQLIHELTTEYLWISADEYYKGFNRLLNSLDRDKISVCKKIYLFRIIKPEDEKKTKSGNHCIYLFRGILPSHPIYRDKVFKEIDTFEEFEKIDFKNDGTELIFLVDDFIGSGDTFTAMWTELEKNLSFEKELIVVLTLAIQQESLELIQGKYSLLISYNNLCFKGINDKYLSPEREEKARIMTEIEKLCKPGLFSFGYNKSEALVTMIRTPDNTFPIFWKTYKIRDEKVSPPFPRYSK